MIYLLYGEDELGVSETISGLKERLRSEDAMADLNTTELEGARLTVKALRAAADALPFMGERRMVVVRGLVGRCNPRGGDRSKESRAELVAALKKYLPAIAPTTRLVLAEGRLEKDNPLLRWARSASDAGSSGPKSGAQARRSKSGAAARGGADEVDGGVVVREFAAPPARSLPAWITKRARARGSEITPDGARALAEGLVREGNVDLRLAATEIDKLQAWADGQPIDAEAVALLVTPVSLETVFKLGDALSEGDGATALTLLHRHLEEGEHPLRMLALVARQVRLLYLTRALLDAGVPRQGLPARLPVPGFVAGKLASQAAHFKTATLQRALERVLEIEVAAKTGGMDASIALDVFVAGMTAAGSPRARTR